MGAREEIAAAATSVDGVTCTPYYRQSTKPGDGSVRLDRIEYPDPFGGLCTWQVLLTLPQDLAAAEKWIEAHLEPLRVALSEALIIRRVQPQQLALDTGTVPVLAIEGTREEES